ncbi:MAG TPA: glycosyltransferase family 2 protein [Chryseolinea sp.]
MEYPAISIVIPTWNGKFLLSRFLKSVMEALQRYPGENECIVVDDGGQDDTPTLMATAFPEAVFVRRTENGGFSTAVNTGIDRARHPWVLLLNNDIEVKADFLIPLGERVAADPELFAVSVFQNQPPDGGETESGSCSIGFVAGEYRRFDRTKDALSGEQYVQGFANGGATLFNREKLLFIGGFCDLLNPFYFEDMEVSIQALKRGWRLAFEPRSIVWHRPNSTTRKKKRSHVARIIARNYFFCHWLTLDNSGLWVNHVACSLLRLTSRTGRGDLDFAAGFGMALLSIPALCRQRRERSVGWCCSLRDQLEAIDLMPRRQTTGTTERV